MTEQNGKQPPVLQQRIAPGQFVQGTPIATIVDPIPGAKVGDGKPRVLLRIESLNGSFQFLLEVPHARQLARHLSEKAAESSGGLVIPMPKAPNIKPTP